MPFRKYSCHTAAVALLLLVSAAATADDRAAYNKLAAAHDTALFHSLDRNADGVVTRAESHGDLDFGPRFDDMDINRDGNVTRQEFRRYIEQRYGVASKG
ncbi:MAG: EF-hand domain-containing protein [Betaproteobacteria bacterium]